MKKTNLSVGIAAYNEEKNIKNILADILKQKQDGCLSFKHLISDITCSISYFGQYFRGSGRHHFF